MSSTNPKNGNIGKIQQENWGIGASLQRVRKILAGSIGGTHPGNSFAGKRTSVDFSNIKYNEEQSPQYVKASFTLGNCYFSLDLKPLLVDCPNNTKMLEHLLWLAYRQIPSTICSGGKSATLKIKLR